jgi:hypothetical protein
MKNKKQGISENLLRKYIKNEIRRIMEADEEETPSAPPAPIVKTKPAAKPAEKPAEKPVAEPEETSEENQGLNADFQAAMNTFIQKLKSSTEPVEHDDLINMVGDIIDRFTTSSEAKLNILRTVKTNIVH